MSDEQLEPVAWLCTVCEDEHAYTDETVAEASEEPAEKVALVRADHLRQLLDQLPEYPYCTMCQHRCNNQYDGGEWTCCNCDEHYSGEEGGYVATYIDPVDVERLRSQLHGEEVADQ